MFAGLVAFMLAFTFGIASSRFDTRKELVRNEANAIETAWLRADFIPPPDREEVKRLLAQYLDERLTVVQSPSAEKVEAMLRNVEALRQRLWQLAVEHGRRELNSDVAALYIDSLNEMFNLHHQRVAVGIQVRIPPGVWLALYALSVLGGSLLVVLALFLQRAGIAPVIYEGWPAPRDDEGAFLNLAPNGLDVLDTLGLKEEIEAYGTPTTSILFRTTGASNSARTPSGRC